MGSVGHLSKKCEGGARENKDSKKRQEKIMQ